MQTDRFAHEGVYAPLSWWESVWNWIKALCAAIWLRIRRILSPAIFVLDGLYAEFGPILRTRTGANSLMQWSVSAFGIVASASALDTWVTAIMAGAAAWYLLRTLNGRKNAYGPIVNARDHEPSDLFHMRAASGPGAEYERADPGSKSGMTYSAADDVGAQVAGLADIAAAGIEESPYEREAALQAIRSRAYRRPKA